MGKALFIVIFSRDNWWVDFEGKAFGPFQNRELAALEARTRAGSISRLGRICEVVVPDDKGQHWVIWSSAGGNDGAAFVPHKAGRSSLDAKSS